MTEPTYTLFKPNDGAADEIVARGVTAWKALNAALNHGRAVRFTIARRSEDRSVWEIARRRPDEPHELVMAVEVPLSGDEVADLCAAAEAFTAIFMSDPSRFWDGRMATDEEFARLRQR